MAAHPALAAWGRVDTRPLVRTEKVRQQRHTPAAGMDPNRRRTADENDRLVLRAEGDGGQQDPH